MGQHRTRQSLGERLQRDFNGTLCDELLDDEVFYTLQEAEVLIELQKKVAALLEAEDEELDA